MAITKSRQSQSGAALAISLILMLVMTTLGVTALNGTRIAEKVSSNAQQKTITYETAESAINSVIASDDYPDYRNQARSEFENPPPLLLPMTSGELTEQLSQSNLLGTSVDISADVSVQYCGEVAPTETSLTAVLDTANIVGLIYDVRSVATISNSNARSDHVVREEYSGLQLFSTGNCIAPES